MSSETKRKEEVMASKKDDSKEEDHLTLGFKILTLLTLIGTGCLFCKVMEFIKKLYVFNPDYEFPTRYQCFQVIVYFAAIVIVKVIFESAVVHYTERIMNKKYFEPGQEQERKKVRIKLATIFFKLFYYSSVSVLAYLALSPLDYFPKELGGNGYMAKMFESGYPNSFFHKKTPLFDAHYLICLAYSFVDFIWLVFVDVRQTDFINMFFHHICTISLIIFSYVTNYSNIGSIVLFLHNISDVVVYVSRIILYTNTYDILKQIASVWLLTGFLYFRMFILGKVIYVIYRYANWEWGTITFTLWSFLIFMYLMHFNWTCIILKRFYDAIFKGEYNDSNKFKTEDNEVKEVKKLH